MSAYRDALLELVSWAEKASYRWPQTPSAIIRAQKLLGEGCPESSNVAGQGELLDSVAAVLSESPTDVILAVADWFDRQDWRVSAAKLRREVRR